jgi:2-C-methyl-D-erythritol 2,4-cyclodiphosphate synthase
VCEKPKITPHVSDIKLALANLLEIAEDAISIKATTTEGLGVIGEGNGIAVYAIASLKKELA